MISGEKTVLSCVDWQITGEGPQERGVQVHKGRKGEDSETRSLTQSKALRADFREGKYWRAIFQQRKQELLLGEAHYKKHAFSIRALPVGGDGWG